MSEVKSEIPLSDLLWLASALRVSGLMRTGANKEWGWEESRSPTEKEGKRRMTGRNSKRSEAAVTLDWLIMLL